jgi:hypothetical protein
LADVLDVILDKGLVLDAYVRVSLVGIEILTIDLRVVVASVDTYLRFAEAVNRLELGGGESRQNRGLPEVMGQMEQGGARAKTKGALGGAMDEVKEKLPGHDGRQDGRRQQRLRSGRDQEEDEEPVGAGDRVKGAVGGAMRSVKERFSPDDDQEDDGERQRSETRSADDSERDDEEDGDGGGRQPTGSRRAPQGRQAPSRG